MQVHYGTKEGFSVNRNLRTAMLLNIKLVLGHSCTITVDFMFKQITISSCIYVKGIYGNLSVLSAISALVAGLLSQLNRLMICPLATAAIKTTKKKTTINLMLLILSLKIRFTKITQYLLQKYA
jgi:hypothetical protein